MTKSELQDCVKEQVVDHFSKQFGKLIVDKLWESTDGKIDSYIFQYIIDSMYSEVCKQVPVIKPL